MTVDQGQYVGMDLDKNGGPVVDAIVEAIQADNPGLNWLTSMSMSK